MKNKHCKLYVFDDKYTGTGCPECSHERVCGLFRDIDRICKRSGPFEMSFYCKDFKDKAEN